MIGKNESIKNELQDSQTTLAETLDLSENRESLDEVCKEILADKSVLSRILKYTVPEFEGIDPEKIAEKYILGSPEVSRVPVLPGKAQPDIVEASMSGAERTSITGFGGSNDNQTGQDPDSVQFSSRIDTVGVENVIIGEGKITFDLRANALLLKDRKGRDVQIIVNVEAQNNFYPGYPISKRGIFYCARMVSAQYGTVFRKSEYGRIRHVYSIWIFMNPPKKRRNTIYRYGMEEKCIFGSGRKMERKEYYDLMTFITICLGKGKPSDKKNMLIGMLDILFSKTVDINQKKKILQQEYGLQMTEKMERMDEKMGGFSYYWEEQGERRGERRGKRQGKRLGKLEQLVSQILKKRDLGQSEERISEDLLEDQKTVSQVFALAEGQVLSDEVVSSIAETLIGERCVNGRKKKAKERLAAIGADA